MVQHDFKIRPESINIPYTLCFLTRGDDVLMLKRNKPPNQGLWNGVGGHIHSGEDPLVCIRREVEEETGFRVKSPRFCGLLTWQGFEIPPGGLYIFTAASPPGDPINCDEGILEWKPRGWVFSSPQVVSNIHYFGPQILSPQHIHPQHFHFEYADGIIQHSGVYPLPEKFWNSNYPSGCSSDNEH